MSGLIPIAAFEATAKMCQKATFADDLSVVRHHGLNANMVFLWRRDPRFGPGREGILLGECR
jgi:hypothetical protein